MTKMNITGEQYIAGKINRNKRSGSGFSEDYSPTSVASKSSHDGFYGSFPGLSHKGSNPFKSGGRSSGANKIPGAGSPKNATPKVSPKAKGGTPQRATGDQTKSSPKLVGY